MSRLDAIPEGCVSVLLLTVLLGTLCPLDASLASPPLSSRPTKQPIETTKVIPDAYGLPSQQLCNLLHSGHVYQARTILARTSRQPGDEDMRQCWLGACFSVEQKYEESVVEFAKVKHMDRAPGCVFHMAARAYAQVQDTARAIEISSLGIERVNDYENYEIRAACYNGEKRYVEAAGDYEKAALSRPRTAGNFHCKAALALLSANRPSQALALIGEVPSAGLEADGVAVLLTKAMCLERLNRWSDAVAVLTTAIALAKTILQPERSAFSLNNCLAERAKCYDKMGKKAEAVADRQRQEQLSGGWASDLMGKRH